MTPRDRARVILQRELLKDLPDALRLLQAFDEEGLLIVGTCKGCVRWKRYRTAADRKLYGGDGCCEVTRVVSPAKCANGCWLFEERTKQP